MCCPAAALICTGWYRRARPSARNSRSIPCPMPDLRSRPSRSPRAPTQGAGRRRCAPFSRASPARACRRAGRGGQDAGTPADRIPEKLHRGPGLGVGGCPGAVWPRSPEADLARIEKVTVADVNRVAHEYLNLDQAVTAVMLPRVRANRCAAAAAALAVRRISRWAKPSPPPCRTGRRRPYAPDRAGRRPRIRWSVTCPTA